MSSINQKLNKTSLSGWGNYPIKSSYVVKPSTLNDLFELTKNRKIIARGNGRSYGDSSISSNITMDMRNFNKIIEYDEDRGLITAESGVMLSDLIYKFLPHGLFPYVTPGTKYVTVGGMVASNIHGKNHHLEGSFHKYILWIDLIQSDGEVIRCSETQNQELFKWTIGGMGLTGIIYRVCFKFRKVRTSWIVSKKIVTKNLNETIEMMEKNLESTYSVAWIDCITSGENQGRSVLFLGEHATENEIDKLKHKKFDIEKTRKFKIPFYLPSFMMSHLPLKIFNIIYYYFNKLSKKRTIQSWDKYFYPLDNLNDWNKLYGKNGFYQFQCVIPCESSKAALNEILNTINSSRNGSFLGVLKKFGKENTCISFPMEGYTLALDFPKSKKIDKLLDKLDKLVLKYDGRFYLTKDSRMPRSILYDSDKRISKFKEFRESYDLKNQFSSYQSERLDV